MGLTTEELELQIIEQEKVQDPETAVRVEEQYNREVKSHKQASSLTRFSLGVVLCLSPEVVEKKRGIDMLLKLTDDILEQDKTTAFDSLYYASVALMRLGELDRSRAVCERLLRMNPHTKAQTLHALVREKQLSVEQKQLQNVSIATAIGVGVGLLAMALSKSRK